MITRSSSTAASPSGYNPTTRKLSTSDSSDDSETCLSHRLPKRPRLLSTSEEHTTTDVSAAIYQLELSQHHSKYISSSKKKPRHRILDETGEPLKKSTLENDSCRDLVSAFTGKTSLVKIPSADEILSNVAHVIPLVEKEIYTSWLLPTHRSATIDNVLQSVIVLQESHVVNIEYYLRAVNKRREHDLGRNHTAPAVFWMLMTSLLFEHSYADKISISEESYHEFAAEFPILTKKAQDYDRMTNFNLHLHVAHTYLKVLFQLITVQGYLEVCLLIVSCLEGRGKHHQRGGKNRAFPFRAYRYLIEKVGNKVDMDVDLRNEFEE